MELFSSDIVLSEGVKILKKVYKIAKKKEDTNLMLGVADRFFILYESLSDPEKTRKHHPVGFARFATEEPQDGE